MKDISPCLGTVNARKLEDQMTSGRKHPTAPANSLTRRQVIAGAAAAFACMAADSEAWGDSPPPDAAASKTLTFLHQEATFKTNPHRFYELLLSSKQFAAFTGMPAKIDPKAGGAFSTFGGLVVGRTVELIPDQRVVQAWRPTHWDPGIYSIVKFELKAQGSETIVILDHTGFPQGEFEHLNPGWKWRYWDPIKKYLG
jgi:activator of HSP90 ATPase